MYIKQGKGLGYLNVSWVVEQAEKNGCHIILGTGGRGTGKTFGSLQYSLNLTDKSEDNNFLFLRRQSKQIKMCTSQLLSPFKAINRETDYSVYCFTIPETDLATIQDGVLDDKTHKPRATGRVRGMAAALSTFSGTRSVDFGDYTFAYYDEFVPERNERQTIKDEGYTFNNLYETINRNRELSGKPPLTILALANSEKINNALYMYYEIVKDVMWMQESGREIHFLKNKGIMLIDLSKSPISTVKKDTFLYSHANKDNRFSRMSLGNKYDIDDAIIIRDKIPLMEYRLIVRIGELYIYQHKSRTNEIVCTLKRLGSSEYYPITVVSINRFKQRYRYIVFRYLTGDIIYQDYETYLLLGSYLSYK